MINIQELKKICSELQMRTGINLEIIDSEAKPIITNNKKKSSTKANNVSSVLTLRNDKRYSLSATTKTGEPVDDSTLQVISLLIEPYFSSRSFADIFRDLIYNKIEKNIFAQLLSSSGISADLMYRLYLIRCDKKQLNDILYVAGEMLDTDSGDMFFQLNDENVILIKESSDEMSADDAAELAYALLQSISMETSGDSVNIAVSNIFSTLNDSDIAYKSACDTLSVGSVCAKNKNVFIAEKLRVELFLDMLPTNILRDFLAENSGKVISEAWGEKLIETVQTLFANDLNLSVAARELYINRNTLVYRLDKIKKISGFNLKSFDDAVMFKILMVIDKLINS